MAKRSLESDSRWDAEVVKDQIFVVIEDAPHYEPLANSETEELHAIAGAAV